MPPYRGAKAPGCREEYLPARVYRQAFNFSSPRHANLVTDDSYHCAITRAPSSCPVFTRSGEFVSWGQVFALLDATAVSGGAGRPHLPTSLTVQATPLPEWRLAIHRSRSRRAPTAAARCRPHFHPAIRRADSALFAAQRATFSHRSSSRCSSRSPPRCRSTSSREPTTSCSSRRPNTTTGLPRSSTAGAAPTATFSRKKSYGSYPVKDVGMNLGWDDEEITDRYIRQLEIDGGGWTARCAAWRVRVRDRRARDGGTRESLGVPEPREPSGADTRSAAAGAIQLGHSPASCRTRFIRCK